MFEIFNIGIFLYATKIAKYKVMHRRIFCFGTVLTSKVGHLQYIGTFLHTTDSGYKYKVIYGRIFSFGTVITCLSLTFFTIGIFLHATTIANIK